jgi:hypothetical protein
VFGSKIDGGIGMNDITKSAAFQEFLQKRCDEILLNDKIHTELNKRLITLDKQIKTIVSREAYLLFMEYESMSVQQENNLISAIITSCKTRDYTTNG